MPIFPRSAVAAIITVAGLAYVPAARAAPEAKVFAEVDGTVITQRDYDSALQRAAARRFYHRHPPDAQFAAFRREVAEALVERILLAAEASRRGIEPDRERVERALAEYERRNGEREEWRERRDATLAALRSQLEQQSVLERLEHAVRATGEPSDRLLRDYYKEHGELFTEPEQIRLSVILLRVDPSAPRAAWDAAREEARALAVRLARGADFGEMAKMHSADPSAGRGGDMGYLHRGMLPEAVYAEAAKLGPGGLSAPLTLLEGVALLRLEDRRPPKLRAFGDVRGRAEELWRREQGERNWRALAAMLRKRAVIRYADAPAADPGARGENGP